MRGLAGDLTVVGFWKGFLLHVIFETFDFPLGYSHNERKSVVSYGRTTANLQLGFLNFIQASACWK